MMFSLSLALTVPFVQQSMQVTERETVSVTPRAASELIHDLVWWVLDIYLSFSFLFSGICWIEGG